MLLGTRLWYSFCGSALSSEVSFEGKMEELCRELGERGKASTSSWNGSSSQESMLSVVSQRLPCLMECLQHAASALIMNRSIDRKARKALGTRVDALLEPLEDANGDSADMIGSWATAEWTPDEIAVVEAAAVAFTPSNGGLLSEEQTVDASENLVSSLEAVVASHKDQTQAVHDTLQAAGEPAKMLLVSTLEHALEVLDAVSLQTPRKDRKMVEAVCQRVERVVDEGAKENLLLRTAVERIAASEGSDDGLGLVVELVVTMQKMHVGHEDNKCLGPVSRLLGCIEHHGQRQPTSNSSSSSSFEGEGEAGSLEGNGSARP